MDQIFLERELKAVPRLSYAAPALIQFMLSRIRGTTLARRPKGLVASNNSFALRVQTQKHDIWCSVYGQRWEFEEKVDLPLKRGRGGSYSEFYLSDPSQLLSGCMYFDRSAELFKQRRGRLWAA